MGIDNMAACGSGQPEDCEDCVQVVRDTKTVEVPCTRNTYQKYTVKVPRQVTEQVPRTVTYTDYESRQKQVPYTVNRSERRIRMQTEKYRPCHKVLQENGDGDEGETGSGSILCDYTRNKISHGDYPSSRTEVEG